MIEKHHNEKGFSLVELLIGLMLLGVVLTAVYNLFISTNKSQIAQDLDVEMQQNARSAADFVVREMRNISSISCINIPSTDSPCPTAGDQINFTSMTDANTRIFAWSSSDFILRFSNTATPSRDPLADNVTTFTLNGFDVNNASTTTRASVNRIDITITTKTSQVDPNTNDYRYYSIKTSVMKRN
jgi:prepilin-type N-terminal cleavage/methylation domain-containing protein